MKWVIFGLVSFFVLLSSISFYDLYKIKTVRYELSSKKLVKNIRIVFLSDLHNRSFGKRNHLILEKIESIAPDFIVIGGDVITAKVKKSTQIPIELINQLTEKYQVYYGLGNHEYRIKTHPEIYGSMYNQYLDSIKNKNLYILDNHSIVLEEENITISGISINGKYYKRFKTPLFENNELENIFGNVNCKTLQILLAHNPEYFIQYDKWGPDLVLSGHFHGGIIRIPFLGGLISPSFQFFPKYDGGMHKGENGSIIISRGLGMHSIPIRIFNPCELVCIDLIKK